MKKFRRLLPALLLVFLTSVANAELLAQSWLKWFSREGEMLRAKLSEPLPVRLALGAFTPGDPVFMRIFKEEAVLELWMQPGGSGPFKLFSTYPICALSGKLGPKLKQGDKQAPEGFYGVGLGQFNPHSRFHSSFNIGYPNAYDRSHGRTGAFIMVHGNCVSEGCFAMTDPYIEEIYALGEHALKSGQPFFRVHIFPFRLTEENLGKHAGAAWMDFWRVTGGVYVFFPR